MGFAGEGGRVDAAGGDFGGNIEDLFGRKWGARTFDGGEGILKLGLSADMTVWRDVFEDFEDDVAAKDDKIVDGDERAENAGNGVDVGGILADGVVELVLVLAVGGDLGPMDAVAVAVDPAEVAFGLENEDSPLVEGETVDLEKLGVRDDARFNSASVEGGIVVETGP